MNPIGSGAELLTCLLGCADGAGHPARQVDRDDVVAIVEQRFVDLKEVTDRGLRGRGEEALVAEGLVVAVVIDDLALSLRLGAPMNVEADLVDVVLREQLARHVMTGVGDDRDGHGAHPKRIGGG